MFDNSRFHDDSIGRGYCRPAECDGKTRYASKAEAISRIKHQRKARGFKRQGPFRLCRMMSPYKCPHCGSWHVGGTARK